MMRSRISQFVFSVSLLVILGLSPAAFADNAVMRLQSRQIDAMPPIPGTPPATSAPVVTVQPQPLAVGAPTRSDFVTAPPVFAERNSLGAGALGAPVVVVDPSDNPASDLNADRERAATNERGATVSNTVQRRTADRTPRQPVRVNSQPKAKRWRNQIFGIPD